MYRVIISRALMVVMFSGHQEGLGVMFRVIIRRALLV